LGQQAADEPALPAVCVLAGGLGTRLGGLTTRQPKPLLEVAGKPFLRHQLALLSEHGFTRVVLCVGYLGEQIEAAIGTSCEGLAVQYSYDAPGLDGTLGAVRRAAPLLGERFLILYGDTYLLIDYQAVTRDWIASGEPALMTVLHNHGELERSNAEYAAGRVVAYDKFAPTPEMEWIDYGLGGLTTGVLDLVPEDERDLASLYHALAAAGRLHGYPAERRFFEIGTPGTLRETEQFLLHRSGAPDGPGPADARPGGSRR